MTQRRSFLAMLGLAPVAAAMPPSFNEEVRVALDRVPIPLPPSPFVNSASIAPENPMDHDAHLAQRIKNARNRVRAMKLVKATGQMVPNPYVGEDKCPCIDSRKATSPAIKAILQADYYQRIALRRAETELKRLEATRIVPALLRKYLPWDW